MIELNGVWRRRYNFELYSLFKGVDVVESIKINRLRLVGNVMRKEKDNIKKVIMLNKITGIKREVDQRRSEWTTEVDMDVIEIRISVVNCLKFDIPSTYRSR